MRRLIIGLLVLVGLVVAADFGVAAVAESAVSREMREQLGLPDDPEVRINGFPFAIQALAGTYASIDVSAPRLQVGDLTDVEVSAQLRGVDAPLADVLGSGPKSLRVAEADGTVRIGADDIERLLGTVDDLQIGSLDEKALDEAVEDGGAASLADLDPDTTAQIYGTTTALGEEMPVSVIVSLELDGGVARIVPRDIRVGADPKSLPEADQDDLRDQFTVAIDPGSLPLEVTPTALRATDDGFLEISGSTTDLVLGAAAPTG